jgi:hypothetical protein
LPILSNSKSHLQILSLGPPANPHLIYQPTDMFSVAIPIVAAAAAVAISAVAAPLAPASSGKCLSRRRPMLGIIDIQLSP